MRFMATMSMNKVIHGAIRRDLDRFEGALTTFRAGDSERAKQLGVAWENFDRQLTDHHEGEHEIAWPALEKVGVTREMLNQMDAEHATMAEALGNARTAMAALVSNPQSGEAEAALAAIRRLKDVTVTHLDHEEQQIEPVYLEQHDSPPIKEMGKQFAKAGPSKAGPFMAWIADGASPEMQQGLRENVPRPGRGRDGRCLRAELPQERRPGLEGLTRLLAQAISFHGSCSARIRSTRAWSILETTYWFSWASRTHLASENAEVVRNRVPRARNALGHGSAGR